jgi:hypothetical protein
MAGAPAYRYDYAGGSQVKKTYQYPEGAPNPSVRVVPGRKSIVDPVLSDTWVVAIKAVIAILAIFLVIGFVRVGLASAAYSAASTSSELSSQIEEARSSANALTVQKSLVANPSNLRQTAEDKLKMTASTSTETITLPTDVVATDSTGNLSFSQSLERLASIG